MQKTESCLTAPVPTPHWGSQSGAAFTVRATSAIEASPQQIVDTLLDTSTWPQWNNFVPRATLTNAPGDREIFKLRPGILFTEHVDMAGRGRSTIVKMRLLMTALDQREDGAFEAVWLGKGYPDWALRSERVHRISKADAEGMSTYDVYETFSGPLAWFVKVFVGKTLVRRFGQWNDELKGFVESGGKRS